MPGLLPRLFVGALAIVFGGLVGLLSAMSAAPWSAPCSAACSAFSA